MTLPYYRPSLREQLQEPEQANPAVKCSCGPFNCNMCTAAAYLERVTLGHQSVSGCSMRHRSGTHGNCTDDKPDNNGTNIYVAASALATSGRHLQVVEGGDKSGLFHVLDSGVPVILHGDYDGVPQNLRGDAAFHGLHSVLLNEHDPVRSRTLVFDPLDDGRRQPSGVKAPQGPLFWPDQTVLNYASLFPNSLVYGYENIKTGVVITVPLAYARSKPMRGNNVIARLHHGDYRDRGDVEHGESINGDDRWYRIWLPVHETAGFIHASVARFSDDAINA